MDALLDEYGLEEIAALIRQNATPAIGFSLVKDVSGRSRFGGAPLLPPAASWPSYQPIETEMPSAPGPPPDRRRLDQRHLEFLLQVDLAEVRGDFGGAEQLLPESGLLTFFYDVENQPWGFDPENLDGSRVLLFDDGDVVERIPPEGVEPLKRRGITFFPSVTFPHYGSRIYEALDERVVLPVQYDEFVNEVEAQGYPDASGRHRLLGHAANIQGDMQLEAQLVSHGLYCGDETGYQDPRAAKLVPGASDWLMLLQLDTDDGVDMMWGDVGMLYFWIRRADLLARRFERTWMTLQCS